MMMMMGDAGIEPATSSMSTRRSPAELNALVPARSPADLARARVGGFEPPTHGFGDRRSDQTELHPFVKMFLAGGRGSPLSGGGRHCRTQQTRFARPPRRLLNACGSRSSARLMACADVVVGGHAAAHLPARPAGVPVAVAWIRRTMRCNSRLGLTPAIPLHPACAPGGERRCAAPQAPAPGCGETD